MQFNLQVLQKEVVSVQCLYVLKKVRSINVSILEVQCQRNQEREGLTYFQKNKDNLIREIEFSEFILVFSKFNSHDFMVEVKMRIFFYLINKPSQKFHSASLIQGLIKVQLNKGVFEISNNVPQFNIIQQKLKMKNALIREFSVFEKQ